jgi:hypothetical protein
LDCKFKTAPMILFFFNFPSLRTFILIEKR